MTTTATTPSTTQDDDTRAAADRDRRTLAEVVCDLTVVEHRLRDVRRWTPEGATRDIDAALTNIATALDSIHAEHSSRAPVGDRTQESR